MPIDIQLLFSVWFTLSNLSSVLYNLGCDGLLENQPQKIKYSVLDIVKMHKKSNKGFYLILLQERNTFSK